MNAIAMPSSTVWALAAWGALMLAAAAVTDAPAVVPTAEAALAQPQPAPPDAVLVVAAPNAPDTELPPQAF